MVLPAFKHVVEVICGYGWTKIGIERIDDKDVIHAPIISAHQNNMLGVCGLEEIEKGTLFFTEIGLYLRPIGNLNIRSHVETRAFELGLRQVPSRIVAT